MNYVRVGRALAMFATAVCAGASAVAPDLAGVLTPLGLVFASFSSTGIVKSGP